MKNCPFCKITRGETNTVFVYEDDRVAAFLELAPLAAGHTLVIPKIHHNSVTTLAGSDSVHLLHVAAQIGGALLRVVDADGFNLLLANGACAGQLVPHVCLQVIPRHPEDALMLPVPMKSCCSDEERQHLTSRIRQSLQKRLT